jgi:4-hydroxy-tetrahydrodipicolinate synthase
LANLAKVGVVLQCSTSVTNFKPSRVILWCFFPAALRTADLREIPEDVISAEERLLVFRWLVDLRLASTICSLLLNTRSSTKFRSTPLLKSAIMTRRGEMFAGLSVALVTPMNPDGSLNEAMLRKLVDFHVDAGTNCVVPVGTTGESPTLSHDEHDRVIDVVCEQAAGRIKVMAGTGSNCTAEAIRMTTHAKAAGADGSLQVAPYYNKPTQEGFFQHFRAISEAVDLPSVLYNIPGRSAKNIDPDTVCRIAEACPNVVAVKDATGVLDQASQILSGSDLTVLSGDDSMTLPLMAIGGSGIISVAGNIIPQDVLALVAAFNAGDIAKAQEWHHKLFPLCRDMLGLSTNPIPVKAAMAFVGMDCGPVRLPMTALSAAEVTSLKATLKTYGLIK